ncbi:MAG TPA: glycoside hydrolase family 1 protein [Candidatus Paceibacterota bacterium]|nr:glycoside hydrolase family 1 protein [Candidatus Paceibacterota bacterium]
MKSFPKNFYWGAATASYQVEGWNENTDWAQAARDGKVPPAGRLADHYHRYEEDFDIAKELGHNAHRFSIEWARIEPEEGKWDFAEIEHYRAVLKALRARNIEPFVTLWHFTLPQWFAKRGGFERADAPQVFARYCAFVAKELGDLCTHFSTMNEPNVYASNGWLRGSWPPFKRFAATDFVSITNSGRTYESRANRGIRPLFLYRRVLRNLARAHNEAYTLIKASQPNLDVGVVKHVIYFHANWNPYNMLRAWVANRMWTHVYMRRVRHTIDSIGLNYYFHKKFGDRAEYDKTDMDWDIYPEGIYGSLKLLTRYRKPIFISEAGLADRTDTRRAAYITEQIRATKRALDDGIDVRGHMYWSLIDNYEWALGTQKCFGLVAINYDTLERTIRPSAWVYKDIIDANGIPDSGGK